MNNEEETLLKPDDNHFLSADFLAKRINQPLKASGLGKQSTGLSLTWKPVITATIAIALIGCVLLQDKLN